MINFVANTSCNGGRVKEFLSCRVWIQSMFLDFMSGWVWIVSGFLDFMARRVLELMQNLSGGHFYQFFGGKCVEKWQCGRPSERFYFFI